MTAKKERKAKPYKFVPLPPNFAPVICTFDEACSYARCTRWTGYQRVKEGRWRTFMDGRLRKVEFDSVVKDTARIRAEGREPAKRPAGRPKTKAASAR